VSFRGHQPNTNGPFEYHKPDLNNSAYDASLGNARLAPQDGRIKLAFDLNSRKVKAGSLKCYDPTEFESLEFMNLIKNMKRSSWGGIFILDTVPAWQTYTQVVYDMDTEDQISVISESKSVQAAWSARFVQLPRRVSFLAYLPNLN